MNQSHPLLEREARAFARLTRMRQLMRDAYEYVLPGMSHDLDGLEGDAPHERPHVFDSTATEAAFGYADRFMVRYTAPNQQFVALQPGLELQFSAPAALEEISTALGRIVETFHRFLEASSFFQAVHRAYLDYSITSGCFNFNSRPDPNNPFSFEAIPIWQVTPEEGPHGSGRTTFRRWRLEARVIEETWPDARLPAEIESAIQADHGHKVDLVEAMLWDHDAARFDYVVLERASGQELVRRQEGEGARILFRNMLPAGVPLGVGPGIRMLPTIRALNKALEIRFMSDELQNIPTLQAPEDHPVFGDGGVLDLEPGTVVPYGPRGKLEALVLGSNGSLRELNIEELREQIRVAFLNDNLPPLGGDVRSATEILERTRNAAEKFEPSATRLDAELLQPLIKRGLAIMQDQGIIPRLRLDGLRVKIVADGPLSRLRRQAGARERLTWFSEVATGLGGEAVLMTTDAEGLAAELLEEGGVDPIHILDERERAERRQGMQAEQSAMMQPGAAA